jgi:hypothetical protein
MWPMVLWLMHWGSRLFSPPQRGAIAARLDGRTTIVPLPRVLTPRRKPTLDLLAIPPPAPNIFRYLSQLVLSIVLRGSNGKNSQRR